MKPDPRAFLPLPAYDLHILLSLLDEPRHGYAVLDDVSTRTAGRVRLGTSTVYAALKRMRSNGLIAETARPASVDSADERRRYYRATALGSAVAKEAARDVDGLHRMLRQARLLEGRSR